jgi:hypothetical protein
MLSEEIIKSRKKENEARDVAIYLLKKTAGISSKCVKGVMCKRGQANT